MEHLIQTFKLSNALGLPEFPSFVASIMYQESLAQSLNVSQSGVGGSLSLARLVGNARAHHGKVPCALEREEHTASYFSVALLLIIVLFALCNCQAWKHREGSGIMSGVNPTSEFQGAPDEDSVDNINETPLLKGLGGHDLSQPIIENAPTHLSYSTPAHALQKDPPKELRAPRAKGRSEPITKAHIPDGAHKALVIGLNGPISHKERPLDYAVQDAKRFEKCLRQLNNLGQRPNSQLYGEFNFEIEVLVDEDGKCVPRTKVLKALATLFNGAKPNDLLVLFFSGHCSTIKPNGIVALLTVEDNHNSLLVPSTVFSQYISKLPPGCTVEVFLDCCYSGGLIKLDNVIQEMTSVSKTTRSVQDSHHIAYGVSAAPRFNYSNSGPSLAATSGTPSTHCNVTPPLAVFLGPRFNEKISTNAHVIVWAASDTTEKAYESAIANREGGALVNTICDKIEESFAEGTVVAREGMWKQVTIDMKDENEMRQRTLPGPYQHARILASFQDSEEIMNMPLFCRGSGR